jgi:hypothetical protein
MSSLSSETPKADPDAMIEAALRKPSGRIRQDTVAALRHPGTKGLTATPRQHWPFEGTDIDMVHGVRARIRGSARPSRYQAFCSTRRRYVSPPVA